MAMSTTSLLVQLMGGDLYKSPLTYMIDVRIEVLLGGEP